MITSGEFVALYADQVRRAAIKEHQQTNLFDLEDLTQEIWLGLLPYMERLHEQGPGFVYSAALNVARQYAERERIDHMYFRGSFIYTPEMVRHELEVAGWISVTTGDWDLRIDMQEAMEALPLREQKLLFAKHVLGQAPGRESADRKVVDRAVDKMTHWLNARSGMAEVDFDVAAEAA